MSDFSVEEKNFPAIAPDAMSASGKIGGEDDTAGSYDDRTPYENMNSSPA